MAKTWLAVVTACTLVAVSAAIYAARQAILGAETSGPLGWEVQFTVEGTLLTKDASVSVVRPPDLRRQHISEERFQSGPELREPLPTHRDDQRRHTWRRQVDLGEPQPFRLNYSFVCSWQRPTAGMERRTAKIDAPPPAGAHLESTPRLQAKDNRITELAKTYGPDSLPPSARARALFDFVSALPDGPSGENTTALACLQSGGGDALAKARLLTALCRAASIPTRLVSGIVVSEQQPQQLHCWAEAWIGNQWVPMDPTHEHFGESFPENYVILRLEDAPVVAGHGARLHYTVAVGLRHGDAAPDQTPSQAKDFWRAISLHSLHPSEQQMVGFLLLLPLAALVVSFARTIIGIRTFGIFAPALIGLAFLDLKALPWGLPIFVLTVMFGWGMRHWLERYASGAARLGHDHHDRRAPARHDRDRKLLGNHHDPLRLPLSARDPDVSR